VETLVVVARNAIYFYTYSQMKRNFFSFSKELAETLILTVDYWYPDVHPDKKDLQRHLGKRAVVFGFNYSADGFFLVNTILSEYH